MECNGIDCWKVVSANNFEGYVNNFARIASVAAGNVNINSIIRRFLAKYYIYIAIVGGFVFIVIPICVFVYLQYLKKKRRKINELRLRTLDQSPRPSRRQRKVEDDSESDSVDETNPKAKTSRKRHNRLGSAAYKASNDDSDNDIENAMSNDGKSVSFDKIDADISKINFMDDSNDEQNIIIPENPRHQLFIDFLSVLVTCDVQKVIRNLIKINSHYRSQIDLPLREMPAKLLQCMDLEESDVTGSQMNLMRRYAYEIYAENESIRLKIEDIRSKLEKSEGLRSIPKPKFQHPITARSLHMESKTNPSSSMPTSPSDGIPIEKIQSKADTFVKVQNEDAYDYVPGSTTPMFSKGVKSPSSSSSQPDLVSPISMSSGDSPLSSPPVIVKPRIPLFSSPSTMLNPSQSKPLNLPLSPTSASSTSPPPINSIIHRTMMNSMDSKPLASPASLLAQRRSMMTNPSMRASLGTSNPHLQSNMTTSTLASSLQLPESGPSPLRSPQKALDGSFQDEALVEPPITVFKMKRPLNLHIDTASTPVMNNRNSETASVRSHSTLGTLPLAPPPSHSVQLSSDPMNIKAKNLNNSSSASVSSSSSQFKAPKTMDGNVSKPSVNNDVASSSSSSSSSNASIQYENNPMKKMPPKRPLSIPFQRPVELTNIGTKKNPLNDSDSEVQSTLSKNQQGKVILPKLSTSASNAPPLDKIDEKSIRSSMTDTTNGTSVNSTSGAKKKMDVKIFTSDLPRPGSISSSFSGMDRLNAIMNRNVEPSFDSISPTAAEGLSNSNPTKPSLFNRTPKASSSSNAPPIPMVPLPASTASTISNNVPQPSPPTRTPSGLNKSGNLFQVDPVRIQPPKPVIQPPVISPPSLSRQSVSAVNARLNGAPSNSGSNVDSQASIASEANNSRPTSSTANVRPSTSYVDQFDRSKSRSSTSSSPLVTRSSVLSPSRYVEQSAASTGQSSDSSLTPNHHNNVINGNNSSRPSLILTNRRSQTFSNSASEDESKNIRSGNNSSDSNSNERNVPFISPRTQSRPPPIITARSNSNLKPPPTSK